MKFWVRKSGRGINSKDTRLGGCGGYPHLINCAEGASA